VLFLFLLGEQNLGAVSILVEKTICACFVSKPMNLELNFKNSRIKPHDLVELLERKFSLLTCATV
jgi:hypothetical protein